MARNRIIYQSEAIYVGPSPATGDHFSSGNSGTNLVQQLHRIQSTNHSWSLTRQDVNQEGQLAAIDRIILETPSVTFDFDYLLTSAINEDRLGLFPSGSVSAISGILNKTEDEKNYLIKLAPEGSDAINYTPNNSDVWGIGNGFLSSYSSTAQVGGLPTVSVSVEALNVRYYKGQSTGLSLPAVNPEDGSNIADKVFSLPLGVSGAAGQVSALRPGDITVDLNNAGLGIDVNDVKIQSYTLSFDLTREPLQKLGSRFAFSREIQFPVTVSASFEANVGDLNSGNLSDFICNDPTYDLTITLNEPTCTGGTSDTAIKYELKGAKLDSQDFGGGSVGGENRSVTMNFSAQLGSAEDLTRGLFVSGKTFN